MPETKRDKVVVVTGASSGIGREVARLAARKGYRVVLNARREDRLRDLEAEITGAGGKAVVVVADMAKMEDQQRLVDESVKAFGRIDILVNNAGLPLPTSFTDSPVEDLRRQWDVNVTALSTLTHIALPYLRRSKGIVVNIGSSISRLPVPGMGNYSATKIAVAGLSDGLRRELSGQGIRVCLVEPGPIATEFTERAGGSPTNYSRLHIPASEAAVPIVRLFEHPQRRIVVPGWMGPLLIVAGVVMRLGTPAIDAIYKLTSRRSAGKSKAK